MYRTGHYGLALVCYGPVGFVLRQAGLEKVALFGAALTIALSRAPDIDVKMPLVTHRGITHTIWFALLVGVVCGAIGWSFASPLGQHSRLAVAAVAGGVGALSIASHLLGDALTPMGIRPLWPLSRRRVTLDLVRADNVVANLLLLLVGVGVSVVSLLANSVPIVPK